MWDETKISLAEPQVKLHLHFDLCHREISVNLPWFGARVEEKFPRLVLRDVLRLNKDKNLLKLSHFSQKKLNTFCIFIEPILAKFVTPSIAYNDKT